MTVTLRSASATGATTKGAPLTYAELDANFVEFINLSGLPQTIFSADYTAVLSDANGHLLHPSTDNNARTSTIPANASVAFDVGTTLTFVNQINTLTIAINSDTLTLVGSGSTGSRTLAANGLATALKVAATEWVINGVGIS